MVLAVRDKLTSVPQSSILQGALGRSSILKLKESLRSVACGHKGCPSTKLLQSISIIGNAFKACSTVVYSAKDVCCKSALLNIHCP